MRSRFNPAWSIEIETPFQCRDYEAEWTFDRAITRILITGVERVGAGQFADLLKQMQNEFGNFLLEADELWGNIAFVQEALQTDVYSDASLNSQNWKPETQRMLADGIISYEGITCSFQVREHPLSALLDRASVREWWGSFWQDQAPFSLLAANVHAHTLDRIEPAMLQSMGSCSPIFFLSPNHAHLELMANPQDTEKLLELLSLY